LKTSFIAKALSVGLACSILALFLVPTGFAYKIGLSGDEGPSAKSCNDDLSSFTIFPYAKLKTDSSGSATGIEVLLSSAQGSCSMKIYSSNEDGYAALSGNPYSSQDEAIALK